MSRRMAAWQLRIKPSGRVLRVPICPSACVGIIKGASPMQAYCVSKRPPRALYLGLAIVLGMVAVSTVVLSQMGAGLLRDGTYLRLLGYSPSNRGASLTPLGPEPGSRPCGRPRPAGGQRDRPRPGEWLS